MAPTLRSDYEALTGTGAERSRTGSSEGSSLGGGLSKSSGGLGLFKVSDQLRSVVFVMDGSASMGEYTVHSTRLSSSLPPAFRPCPRRLHFR